MRAVLRGGIVVGPGTAAALFVSATQQIERGRPRAKTIGHDRTMEDGGKARQTMVYTSMSRHNTIPAGDSASEISTPSPGEPIARHWGLLESEPQPVGREENAVDATSVDEKAEGYGTSGHEL